MSRCRLTREELDYLISSQREQSTLLRIVHREIVTLNKKVDRVIRLIEHPPHHAGRTESIEVTFTPPHPPLPLTHPYLSGVINMADLTLLVGQSSLATIVPLEADGTTVTPGATLSNATFSLSDPGLAIGDNGDGTAQITATAPTASDVTGSISATVTDADGTTGQFSGTFTVSVGGTTPPTNRTAGIGVQFSTPQ